MRWLRPDYQIPRFGKNLDKMAAEEEGAQIAAELGLGEPSARSMPSGVCVSWTSSLMSV